MTEIVTELEVALEKQKFPQISRYLFELGKLAEPPLSYKSQEELLFLLSEGFLYMETTWLSVNKSGRVCEMISATKCITKHKTGGFQVVQTENSRFDKVVISNGDFKVEVSTRFLVPHDSCHIHHKPHI
ncbi:hypothetical protein L6452_31928 [Arctium lappa]|uniref:Uncharacterized protein n=1 Tax=Arctium lappa TaxID=4217 RepID=A0ACB8Z379_ARCLA|nr:hypothetical protein L6452_31928 [Arctium lappa]